MSPLLNIFVNKIYLLLLLYLLLILSFKISPILFLYSYISLFITFLSSIQIFLHCMNVIIPLLYKNFPIYS